MSEKLNLLVGGAHGAYIPQIFAAQQAQNPTFNLKAEDLAVLAAGPDHEEYWDAWTAVYDSAKRPGENGHNWFLYTSDIDGDLMEVRDDYEWGDE